MGPASLLGFNYLKCPYSAHGWERRERLKKETELPFLELLLCARPCAKSFQLLVSCGFC